MRHLDATLLSLWEVAFDLGVLPRGPTRLFGLQEKTFGLKARARDFPSRFANEKWEPRLLKTPPMKSHVLISSEPHAPAFLKSHGPWGQKDLEGQLAHPFTLEVLKTGSRWFWALSGCLNGLGQD